MRYLAQFKVEVKNFNPYLRLYFHLQNKDPLIGLLVGSALISILTAQYDDAVSITIAVIIVVTVGFVQEHRSEKVLEKLTRLIPPKARLIRNQIERDVFASELVVGDIVLLAAGDRVPADVRLFEGTVSFFRFFISLID